MLIVDLNVKLQLSEDVERKAREAGLFTGEKIAQMIEAEVQRQRQAHGNDCKPNSRRFRRLFGKNTSIYRMMMFRQ